MKINKQFSPAKNETPTGETPITQGNSTGNMPIKDADFLTLAEAVNTKWKATPEIKLLWIDQPTYATLVVDFDTNFTDRLAVGSNRPTQTQALAQTNLQIDDAVKEVRVYIQKNIKKPMLLHSLADLVLCKKIKRIYCQEIMIKEKRHWY
jgi:hypothetical protein